MTSATPRADARDLLSLNEALVQVGFRVPAALARAVRAAALEDRVPVQAWVAEALRAHLAACEAGAPDPLGDAAAPRTAAAVRNAGHSGGHAD